MLEPLKWTHQAILEDRDGLAGILGQGTAICKTTVPVATSQEEDSDGGGTHGHSSACF